MTAPAPLKTILSPTRYPYAVAVVRNNKIACTVAYTSTLEDCYAQMMGWRSYRGDLDNYIMAEMQDLDNTTSYSYWCAV